jgi:PRC-barrel domain
MAAFDQETLERWRALAIVDREGSTVGTINEFYLDRETGYPTWALVSTGLFGGHRTFVPLVHASEISDGLQVPYEKSHIKDAPRVDLHDELSPDEEAVLLAHYGVEYTVAEPVPVEGPGPVPATPAVVDETSETEAEAAAAPPPEAKAGPRAGDASETDADTGAAAGSQPDADAEVRAGEGSEADAAAVTTAGSPPEAGQEPGATSPAGTGVGGSTGTISQEPGSADATQSDTTARSEPPEHSEVVPDEPGTDETTGDRYDVGADTPGRVPDEPGTAGPDEASRTEPSVFGAEETERPGDSPAAEHPDPADADRTDPDSASPGRTGADRFDADPGRAGRDGAGLVAQQADPASGDHDRFRTLPGDPDLSRTAPVEPGLPGSTAASRRGYPSTVAKDADESEGAAEKPLQPPGEAGWSPGAAGSFEAAEPIERPAGSSDRWREAKLAAERDRIARAADAQPEERSPLERARRRLERLVGVGQDHSDSDPVSPAEHDAAERDRRARLGLDEDDNRRR